MNYPDESYNLRIELDTKECALTPEEIERMEKALSPLRQTVERFPISNLYVTIEFKQPSHDYRVKTALRLTGKGLTTGDVDKNHYTAFQRCINKLIHKVTAYKDALANAEEISKHEEGTHHEVLPSHDIDFDALDAAVEQGNYGKFRELLFAYEEPIRKRIGRWIQRYPELEAQLGEQLKLADFVEEVFLNAFERYENWPRKVGFGDWLEDLIDPSVKLISEHPQEELENISFVRSAMEAEQEGGS